MSAIAFISTDRRHALANGQALPEHTHGAALFIDVSGFTPLAEALSRTLGAQHGPEEISRTLNRIYEALIAEVERFGGSVIAFSGDAITCWFDGDDGRRATAAAMRAQQAMGAFSGLALASGGMVALGIKAAVVAGPVNRWVVGDPDILLFDTLAGKTLERMAAVEHLAHRGEVVVSSEVFPALAHTALVTEWRTEPIFGLQCPVISGLMSAVPPQPWPPLPAEALAPEQVRPWVVGTIYDRVEGAQNEFLAELRPGVAVFVHFEGIDYDHDPAAQARLDAFVRWTQRVVHRYDGHILQLTIGDKGSYLYGAFGAPLAHDDDPKRAVLAAHDLSQLPPDLAAFLQPVRVGLAHGHVRAGSYGSAARRTYGVLGDTVNLAARLMQAASPGQVLVNASLKKSADKRMAWKALPPLKVKGKAQPVAVFQLEAIATTTRRRATGTGALRAGLVGREAERTRLTNFVDRVRREQRGYLITLEGEAGIGKSRLLEDLGVYARAARFNTLWSTADAVDAATPFHIWRGIFLNLLDWDNHPDDDSRRHAIMTLIGEELDGLAPLVNVVTPPLFEDNELTEHLTGATRANSTREILFLMLQNAARQQPVCLILEDAHWMDSASWQLLDLVQQRLRTAPLALALGLRPMATPPPEFEALTQVITHERILLRPLTAKAVTELVALRLGAAALDPVVSALIQRRAEGNPFFSEELALNLRDAGLIHVQTGVACPAPNVDLNTASVPDTVQGVVTSRIDRLTPDQQVTLKVASVIGREFAEPPLQAVHPVTETRPVVPEHLRALSELSLVTPVTDHFQFKHNITHEVAYQLMLFAQRRALHQAMGEWLENAGQPDEAALAYHWGRAAAHVHQLLDPVSARAVCTRARQHLTRAGERAMRISAFREAVTDLTHALDLAADDHPVVQADLRLKLATAHEAQGEFAPALDQLRAAHDLAQAHHDQPAVARALNGLGWVLLRQGHYAEARIHLQAALDLAHALHDRPGMALALRRLGVVTARQDRAAAIPFYTESLAIYRDLGDEAGEAACLNNLGNIATRDGRFDEAETYYNAGLTLARLQKDWLTIGVFLGNLGEIARRRKQFSSAARHLQDALAIARQIGARENLATNLMNLGEVTAQQGDWAGAERHYRQALQVAREIGALPRALGALAGLATLQAAHGNYERAAQWATLALSHPASNAEVKDQAEPPLNAARRFLSEAEFAAAQQAAAQLSLDTL